MSDDLNFESLDLIEVPVTLAGKPYMLREASDDAACKYRNALMQGAQMEGAKITKLGSMASAEPLLVSLCLFETDGKGRKTVPLAAIRKWPSRVVKRLFDKAKEISELDEGEETEENLRRQLEDIEEKLTKLRENPAKNAPSDTPEDSV